MKNIKYILRITLLLLVLQSCTQVDPGGDKNPKCEWNDTDIIYFSDVQLKHPSDISSFHASLIPLDGIERQLPNIIYTNGDAPNGENSAKIVVALMSDGMYCIGSESRKYYIGHGEQYVGGASISEIPFVSNAAFVGEVKVIITTDVYNNYSGGDAYYHVRWEETGNDPNGGIVGNIVGQKITHLNVDGTQSILVSGESGYLYSGGTKNWL